MRCVESTRNERNATEGVPYRGGDDRRENPIQLAWMVNKMRFGRCLAENLLHHPGELDGAGDHAAVRSLASHLLHHRGKLDGIESGITPFQGYGLAPARKPRVAPWAVE